MTWLLCKWMFLWPACVLFWMILVMPGMDIGVHLTSPILVKASNCSLFLVVSMTVCPGLGLPGWYPLKFWVFPVCQNKGLLIFAVTMLPASVMISGCVWIELCVANYWIFFKKNWAYGCECSDNLCIGLLADRLELVHLLTLPSKTTIFTCSPQPTKTAKSCEYQ